MANYVFEAWEFLGYNKNIDKNSDACSYPSVSAIVGQLDKSAALIPWAQRMTCDYIIEHWEECRELDGHKLTNFMDDAKKIALQKRDEAGQYGTNLHKILEMAILGEKIESKCDDDVEFYLAISEWVEEQHFNKDAVQTEMPVVNIEAGYAGCVDLYDFSTGILYDLKTSKQIYDAHILQMAGYWSAINAKHFFSKEVSKAKILHWDKQEKVLSEVDITNKVKKQIDAFLFLVDFYYSHKNRRVKNARTKK